MQKRNFQTIRRVTVEWVDWDFADFTIKIVIFLLKGTYCSLSCADTIEK